LSAIHQASANDGSLLLSEVTWFGIGRSREVGTCRLTSGARKEGEGNKQSDESGGGDSQELFDGSYAGGKLSDAVGSHEFEAVFDRGVADFRSVTLLLNAGLNHH